MPKLAFKKSKKRLGGKQNDVSVVASSTRTSASVQAEAVDSVLNVGTQEEAAPTESLSQKVSDTTASRKRSWVWEHFEEYTHKEVVKVKGQEDVVKETRRAKSALKFKKAFARMGEDEDSGFLAYFKEPEELYNEEGELIPNKGNRGKVGPPSEKEWEKAEIFVQFLRVFYEITLRVSASNHPTIHTTFHDVLSIETEINKLFVEPEMATGSEVEKVLTEMAANMNAKFLKYYGSFKDLNPLVFMGLVLDPSWLRGNDICCIEDAPCIQDTEFYEKCEKEHSSSSSSVTSCPPPKSKGTKNSGELQNVEVIDDDEDDEGEDDEETKFSRFSIYFVAVELLQRCM
ncbi:hypothetical protein M0R45_012740 [Rubus argutus]|uniref:hAT-like transposase RNase-H fold domain-containing protein n=1 Tax=Rubus argutus TaxID=59490 RepID=A0AAW1XG48_RUBAR